MRLVIDTNRIFAGLIRDSVARDLILDEHLVFFAPLVLVEEIEEHWDYLLTKSKMYPEKLFSLLDLLLSEVSLVSGEQLEGVIDLAVDIMEPIDVKDSLFVAVGLALDLDGIWTEDRHFRGQDHLPVYSTADLLLYLRTGGK